MQRAMGHKYRVKCFIRMNLNVNLLKSLYRRQFCTGSQVFYEVDGIFIPVFSIHPVFFFVEVELVHPKGYQEVFGLPQFFV